MEGIVEKEADMDAERNLFYIKIFPTARRDIRQP